MVPDFIINQITFIFFKFIDKSIRLVHLLCIVLFLHLQFLCLTSLQLLYLFKVLYFSRIKLIIKYFNLIFLLINHLLLLEELSVPIMETLFAFRLIFEIYRYLFHPYVDAILENSYFCSLFFVDAGLLS